jgi:hypothetical protein
VLENVEATINNGDELYLLMASLTQTTDGMMPRAPEKVSTTVYNTGGSSAVRDFHLDRGELLSSNTYNKSGSAQKMVICRYYDDYIAALLIMMRVFISPLYDFGCRLLFHGTEYLNERKRSIKWEPQPYYLFPHQGRRMLPDTFRQHFPTFAMT